ncbi:MAG: sterol desaturase family protein [Zetaproteobacteria bacterium]|nr:MAG: sterol desaturase family protein [Zetaproteobacteria bacterium]
MDAAITRLGVFTGMLLLMGLWESLRPFRPSRIPRWRHWLGNLSLLACDAVLLRLLFPGGAVLGAWWAARQGFGLLHWLQVPEPWAGFVALIALDGLIYAQHVAFHRIPWLWRLHMVHHADQALDVTSGLRFHPLEIVLSMAFKLAVIALLGAPPWAVLLFEIVLNGMAMFNHANVCLPRRIEPIVRALFVTPEMHRIHHSIAARETNSNYGFNLSLWDRLFGTYVAAPAVGHRGVRIGLTPFLAAPTHRLSWMLRLPFAADARQYPPAGQGGSDERDEG